MPSPRGIKRTHPRRWLLCLVVALAVIADCALIARHPDPQTGYSAEASASETTQAADVSTDTIDCDEATVKRVVDGDTIVVDGIGYVRLIGIDAPESVHPDESRNTEEGEESSDFLKSILSEGDTVYLEYDEERTDRYDRTLAYVWLSEPTSDEDVDTVAEDMLQGVILKAGMAEPYEYEPNTKYADVFEQIYERRDST